jgi:hypothetical protein
MEDSRKRGIEGRGWRRRVRGLHGGREGKDGMSGRREPGMTSRRSLREERDGCERRGMQEEVAREGHPKRSLRRFERTISPSRRVRGTLSYSHRDYDVLFSTIQIPEIAVPSSLAAVFCFAQDGLGSRIALVDANRQLGDVSTDYHTSTCMEASDSLACVMVSLSA